MNTLQGLPDDMICLIMSNMHFVVLLKVLMTCKQLYAMRKTAIKENSTIQGFERCNPDTSFQRVFFNSDVEYDQHMHPILKSTISSSPLCIYNTFKLYAFDNVYNDCDKTLMKANAFSMSCYYARQIAKMYPKQYCNDTIVWCSKNQFNRFIERYNWNYTNINLFDIYNIMFCVRCKNYRKISEIIETMQMAPPSESCIFIEICRSLMAVLTDINGSKSYDKNLKASIISIFFKFMLCVPMEFINDNMLNALFVQCDALGYQIDHLKYIPKYLKKTFRKPLDDLKRNILTKL